VNLTDKAEFAKVVLAFAELKSKQLSLPAIELYWLAMQDWDLSDFKLAATRLLKTAEFMPTPKDFEDLRKAGRMTSGEAFAKAIGWARSGVYRNPAKTPEAILIDRVVHALGGWIAISNYDEEKLHFLEKSFIEHYETIQDATDTREALPQITKPDWLQLGIDSRRKALAKLETES
jgi:hypothetical protein